MITSGELPVGTRLPTVRELSRRLGVSPTTVSEAWRSLADVGAIEARGRNGTYVRPPTGPGRAAPLPPDHRGAGALRARPVVGHARPGAAARPRAGRVAGRQAVADVELPRPPGAAGAGGASCVASWPFPPEAMTVVDGAMDALDRVAQVVLRLGDRVVVEHPGFPPLLDLLDQLGCDVVGVDVDDEGLDADGLRRGARPAACGPCSCSPGPQNPAGSALTRTAGGGAGRRARRTGDTIVIEDDHANDISAAPLRQPRRVAARARRCTSAATPRATGPTCGWPRSAAPATSSPRSPTAACSVPAGRAGSSRRCCSSCCRTRRRRR